MQVLVDAVEAGARVGAIFKEPTVTPTAEQVKELGLKKPLPSPNGLMRKGWNGITISRDTIHIEGLEVQFSFVVVVVVVVVLIAVVLVSGGWFAGQRLYMLPIVSS